ncbi:MAG: dihydropteroate synthase, partial [Planctomycetota bacterium]
MQPAAAGRWRWELSGGRFLELGARALLMGIVNVTPDSFSDGGLFLEKDAAVEQGLALAGEGAEIVDVGGQSTRPGSAEVSAGEELGRVIPVIEGLRARSRAAISVDTYRSEVARAALD